MDESWTDVATESGLCFLKFVPDLATTHAEQLAAHAGLDDATMRIE